MPVTRTREKAVEITKTAKTDKIVGTIGAGKDGKESESEYPENLAQVPFIRYPITFRKKSVPMLALFNSGSKVNTI